MRDDLIDFETLKDLLGYCDDRSVKSWCFKNNLPVISLGAKKYIQSHLLTVHIDNQLVKFAGHANSGQKSNEKFPTAFTSDSEIVARYLAKYESNSKEIKPKESS